MKKQITKTWLFAIATLILCGAMVSCNDAETIITIESLLNEMVDRDAVARFPQSDYRLKQQSSYNRASVTPEDAEGWFINKDFNYQ